MLHMPHALCFCQVALVRNCPDPPSLNFFLSCAFTCHCPNGGRASPLLSGRASPLQHCMWASLTQKRKRTLSAVTGIVLLPTSRPSSTARACRRTFLHNRHQCRGLRPCFTSTGWRADGGGPRLCRTILWNCMCRSRAKSLTLWHCRCKYYPVCLCMPLLRLLLTPKVPIFPRSQPILQGDHLLLGGPQLLLQIFILLPRYPIAPIGISPAPTFPILATPRPFLVVLLLVFLLLFLHCASSLFTVFFDETKSHSVCVVQLWGRSSNCQHACSPL